MADPCSDPDAGRRTALIATGVVVALIVAALVFVVVAVIVLGRRLAGAEMVTTDVTAGRPYRLPFDPTDETKFFYDPAELARFFPARVLARMARGAAAVTVDVKGALPARKTLLPFPDAPDLPVIVAARMSMSFPFLFSAVPLYAANRAACAQMPNGASAPEFLKAWFSDGGLSSNIPIHFFDGPIPRWPTFALNLRGFPTTRGGRPFAPPVDPQGLEIDKVFPATAYDPDVETLEPTGGKRLFGFVNSLLDAMRNWNDNTLMQLPGYRERTVEIAMTEQEGGLNLVMPELTLRSIMKRGYYAGDLFETTFALPALAQSPAWQNHRHIRLRSALLTQSEWTRRFGMVWAAPLVPAYPALVSAAGPAFSIPYRPAANPPDPRAPGQIASALAFATYLAAAPAQVVPGVTLTDLPHPAPELRPRPRV